MAHNITFEILFKLFLENRLLLKCCNVVTNSVTKNLYLIIYKGEFCSLLLPST